MASDKKTHIISGVARGKGSGDYSGQEQAATRPALGKRTVYAGHARSSGHSVQPGATAAGVRRGK